jgi:integrase/recombinase XerD
MGNIQFALEVNQYLNFCFHRKNLDKKTIKSYSIDLKQFENFNNENNFDWQSKSAIEIYIESLHTQFQPKSVKRKIASIKAFFHYLELEEILEINPFHKIQIKYKEPFILPKTIPLKNIETIISFAYLNYKKANTNYAKKTRLRNALILELLFATGMRISELCTLKIEQIDLTEYIIKIYGKGSKERLIQICNHNVQELLQKYIKERVQDKSNNDYLLINRLHNRLSEQSVRNMITNYAKQAGIPLHITPHMFRHSFATLLLEEDVDIRYIQQMLGHSSITTTQIYTHTSINKQKSILTIKHPRNNLNIGV